jgi:hypothetical protein
MNYKKPYENIRKKQNSCLSMVVRSSIEFNIICSILYVDNVLLTRDDASKLLIIKEELKLHYEMS